MGFSYLGLVVVDNVDKVDDHVRAWLSPGISKTSRSVVCTSPVAHDSGVGRSVFESGVRKPGNLLVTTLIRFAQVSYPETCAY